MDGENSREFDANGLIEYGEHEARRLVSAGYFPARREARRIRADMAALVFSRAEGAGAAWEWLADNRYLIEREARAAAADFGAKINLRAGRADTLVCEAALSLAEKRRGDLGPEAAAAFFEGFQRVTPLTLRELNLLGAALRAALVKLLREEFDSGEPDDELAAAAITSLRSLATADLTALMESADLAGRELARDPAGAYAAMDERSRALYRRRLAEIARRSGMTELECARRVLALAQEHAGDGKRGHVGWWILAEPLGRRSSTSTGALYALGALALAAAVSAAAGFISGGVWTALLTLLPALEIAKNALDALLLRVIPPRILPRMELAGGVPDEGRTVCAVSAVLASAKDADKLARRLETFRCAARDCGGNLLFALLADLPEAKSETMPADAGSVAAARAAVDALNEKYGGGFYLLIRKRRENARDGVWTPHERKRGALMALAALCSGMYSELECLSGDAETLAGARYILALDADTTLLPGAARELIGAMLHPLNRAVIDPRTETVASGRGIIHPRVSVELAASERTRFARTVAGPGGVDPYGSVCGEVWMDLTGRGGFAGKGIIDVRALLECCSSLPEGLVLSHDAVEGALLRGGYMGDTELTDGFPATPVSYFKRQHRWVRGDWQNLAVLVRLWGRLAVADRLKLIDSVRRSLSAPAMLAAMVLAAFFPRAGLLPAAVVAVLALCSGLPGAVVRALTRRSGREKHPGSALYGVALRMGQVVLRLVFLPWEAWTNLSAAAAALWRMTVSHRRLLQWQTSAQTVSGGLRSLLAAAWPQLALGAALIFLSPEPVGKTLGIVWLVGALFALPLGADLALSPALTRENRRFLLGECAKIWRYFDEMCTPERGFLPPDNYQEQPPVGAAERTSPTNIGLAMVSALAALDLGAATRERALGLIENMLRTCDALPKWRGHLYNWYDIRSLRPMEPRYVSTVDSGNLAASLTALAAGLREYGRADLAAQALHLRDGMDFAALYDKSRRLFRIGFDAGAGRPGEGCYDLLASEARLTGYYAVAHGDVPARHWRQLSRALVGRDGYRGLASWTGTMFEYLMPELFLPLSRGSLLWESARFCLYVQRRDVPDGTPWGQSESAFYSLDAALAYRYKAHGCASLALQRGMDEDTVCAPYAACLALAVAPNSAVRDLRRFAAVDAGGRYGLWEAIDYTPRRCVAGRGEVVRCVMAHHLGMSIISAANCLMDGVMRRRFMSEPAMAAFAPLLTERAPEGAVTLRRRGFERPERPRERRINVASASARCAPTSAPRVFPLSNGVYSLHMTETGLSCAQAGGVSVYRGYDSAVHGPAGLRLRLLSGGEERDLLPVPGACGGMEFNYRLRGGLLRFEGRDGSVESAVTSGVSARDTGEVRIVELTAHRALRGHLELELEPVLARGGDYAAHPAYWRLGLHAAERDGALLIRRLPRQGAPGYHMCIAADTAAEFRANIDGAPLGWLAHPYVTVRAAVNLAAGETFRVRFAVAFGATDELALEAARRCLSCGAGQIADLASALGAVYALGPETLATVPDLAGRIAFPRIESGDPPTLGELWAAGISGDLPIVTARVQKGVEEKLAAVAARHALLRLCGVKADLVFLTGDAAEYHRAGAAAVTRALAAVGLESLFGARGGIHCAGADSAAALERAAAVALEPDGALPPRRYAGFASDTPLPGRRSGGEVEYGQRDGAFCFTVRGSLPRKAWSLPMSNGRFGYLAADSGLGNMWAANAREERVNAWICDERAVLGPETLETESGGRLFSLFAAEDGEECRVTFGLGWARWEKLGASVTAFVPAESAARIFIIENAPGPVRWHTSLQLAAEARDACFTVTRLDGGVLCAHNARSGMDLAAALSCGAQAYTCDEAAWYARKPGGETGAGLDPCFAVVLPPEQTLVIACGCCGTEELRGLADAGAARRELARVQERCENLCRRLEVSTPWPELDNYLNGWAVYQALVCRMTARTSLYQSGGAFGFRDQLQDAVNLMLVDPALARERIIDSCAHQYAEGDVMHWWHRGEPDHGVRTRISDDLVWLPWAVCEYLDATGDRGILAERVAGLSGAPLAEGENSRYEAAVRSGETPTVLEHAAAALQCVLRRGFGAHGLLLMGTGDWCDGFDGVGAAGKGESVWLTEFFAHTARRFAALLDTPSAAVLTSAARRCGKGIEAAWDGTWYRRGYFDGGGPLGSAENRGCRIDSIAQSWAAFAGCDSGRVDTALTSALENLADRQGGPVRLFTPPFGEDTEHAGYVNSYGPGFRENGGQYTHGAIWLAMACLERGRREDGLRILLGLLRRGAEYGAEPFVLAADVYANPDRFGEAGWSWYTGSAGWFYRAALTSLLGAELKDGELRLPSGREIEVKARRVEGKFTKILPREEH